MKWKYILFWIGAVLYFVSFGLVALVLGNRVMGAWDCVFGSFLDTISVTLCLTAMMINPLVCIWIFLPPSGFRRMLKVSIICCFLYLLIYLLFNLPHYKLRAGSIIWATGIWMMLLSRKEQ